MKQKQNTNTQQQNEAKVPALPKGISMDNCRNRTVPMPKKR